MKLTNLKIDDYGVCQRIQLDDFTNGINVIHGPNGSGKTTIRDFFTSVLFGYSDATESLMRGVHSDRYSPLRGSLEAIIGERRLRITRDNYSSRDARYELITGVGKTDATTTSGLNESAFRTVYDVGFRETRNVVPSIVSLMRSQFGNDKGNARWRSESEFGLWKEEADARRVRLESLQRRIVELRASRSPIQLRIEDDRRHYQMRLDEIDRHFNEISASSEKMKLQLRDLMSERETVEREIAELTGRIEETRGNVRYVPVEKPALDRLATLYGTLDEIDEQIGRWREVQNDIQMHRVQIRDDLTQWKVLSVDSTDHPYHRSQQLLHSLESKVIEAEKEARKPVPQDGYSGEKSRRNDLVLICNKMRDEIYELCEEIGRQYRNVRHRSAAGELKQLRRCYHELDDSVSRLVARRNTVVDEVRELDPQGADAILRADLQFCRCAKHEGFLAARQQTIGPIPTVSQNEYHIVQHGTNAEELQLAELYRRRDELVGQLSAAESQLQGLLSRRELLLDERHRMDAKFEFATLQNRLEQIESELQTSVLECEDLHRQVEEDRPWYQWTPNPIYSNVSSYAQRVTCGDLIDIRFSDNESTPVVTDSAGRVLSFDSLSRGNQDQVCLSLCLAAVDAFADRGIQMPILFDDVFVNIDQHRATATMGVLRDFCLRGHQVILFTCHHHIADQLKSFGTTVFELPMTTTTTTPVSVPGREPIVPRSEFIHSDMPSKRFSSPDTAPVRPNRVRPTVEPVQEIYRYPSERRAPTTVSRTTRFADQDTIISDRTSLRLVQLFEPDELANLKRCGISKVGDLLDIDPTDTRFELSKNRINENDLDRWQACCWLMVCVPGLQACDATVLHDCGICEPEQVSSMTSDQIEIRISRHLESGNGRNSRIGHGRYDSRRISNWLRNLERTRSSWNSNDGQSRNNRRMNLDDSHDPNRRRDALGRATRPEWRPRNERGSELGASAVQRISPSKSETKSKLDSSETHKFFLDRSDDIDAAPSIGAKTAERFHAIGVKTVADFLSRDPEEMAEKLDYRRLNVKTLTTWQKQAKLVCRVPNLRGHDAQILVACNINTPEDISAKDPQSLMKIIGPFSKTKEGEKIIRNGKKPDLDEIKNWISWAANTRAIQAA